MFQIPIVNVKANPLDALLAGLGFRLGQLAQKSDNESFSKLIAGKTVTLQFSSQDGVARIYEFKDGQFNQHQGKADTADLIIDFKDSTQGAKLLAQADTAALMNAIQDGDVVVTGDYKLVLWFASLAKLAIKIPDEYKPYIEKAKPYFNKTKGIITELLVKIKNS